MVTLLTTVVVRQHRQAATCLVAYAAPERSYSDHDTQGRGIAGIRRDGLDHGLLNVDVRPQGLQCSAGHEAPCGTLLVLYLCIRLFHLVALLVHVPQSADVMGDRKPAP